MPSKLDAYADIARAVGETAFSTAGNTFYDFGALGAQAITDPSLWAKGFSDPDAAEEFARRKADRRAKLPDLSTSPKTEEIQSALLEPIAETAKTGWGKFKGGYPEVADALVQYGTDPRVMHTLDASILASPATARIAKGVMEGPQYPIPKSPGMGSPKSQEGIVNFLGENISSTPVQDFQRVSTRYPTSPKGEDPISNILEIGIETMTPAQMDKAINVFRDYDIYGKLSDDSMEALEQISSLHRDNLKFIMKAMPDEMRTRAETWYEGANRVAQHRGQQFDRSPESVSAAIAALSPQTDWDLNVARADRIMEMMDTRPAWTSSMDEVIDRTTGGKKSKYGEAAKHIRGKNFDDLNNSAEKAVWLRAWDEANNPKEYNFNAPEGDVGGVAVKLSGEPQQFNWGSFTEIEKAVSVLDDPSIENISKQLGKAHKIRNFFNNISAPGNRKDTTMDTHAIAASLMQPLGGSARPVLHNFGDTEKGVPGAGGSAITGQKGTYPIHMQAYQQIAESLDKPARGVQSIAWEGVRALFDNKSEPIKRAAREIWSRHNRGELSADQARKQIHDLAGGITQPAWMK